MRKNISFFQFFLSLTIGIYSLITFLSFQINNFSLKQFIFMTTWNFWISTIYLVTISICDFSWYMLESNLLDKLNELFREKLSPAFTALTYLVTFTFWVMIFPTALRDGDPNFGMGLFFNLHVHLILTIFQTIDIFFSYRKNKGIVLKYDFIICLIIMGIYSVLMLVLTFGYNIAIYPFLENMTWFKAFIEFQLFQYMIFIFYLIHVGLIKLKAKYNIFVEKKFKKIE